MKKKVLTNLFVWLFFTSPVTTTKDDLNPLPQCCSGACMGSLEPTAPLPQQLSTCAQSTEGWRAWQGDWGKGAILSGTFNINSPTVPRCHTFSSNCSQMAIVGCWFLGSLKAFLSPLPPLHTPPDAAWFCPVTIELGVHSRVTAAPSGQEPEIPRSLGPKARQRLRNERVEGGGWRNEVCQVEQGRNLGSPRHWETT